MKAILFATASALLLSLPFTDARAAELPKVKPERVSMSSERLQRISALMKEYVDTGRLAGAVTVIARDGKVVFNDVIGRQHLTDGTPMADDTLFRIYSMTKPITAVAALMLYEEGRFLLSDPITDFVPELRHLTVFNPDGDPTPLHTNITMHQLLTHTAGFGYGMPDSPAESGYRDADLFASEDLDEFTVKLARLPLVYQPGTRWHYSVAVDITGLIVERLSGMPLDEFFQQRIFAPLGMNDTFFEVPSEKRNRFGTNHLWDAEQQRLQVLEDGRPLRWTDVTLFSGGGGLISTARDYLRFAEMLRNSGALEGNRLLSPKTVQFMSQNHLPGVLSDNNGVGTSTTGRSPGLGFGLGFGVMTDPTAAGVIASPGEYSWGGAAGTIFWIDPVEEVVVVCMIQLMNSPWPLRAELHALTYQALTAERADAALR